jgi:hypothetical protein
MTRKRQKVFFYIQPYKQGSFACIHTYTRHACAWANHKTVQRIWSLVLFLLPLQLSVREDPIESSRLWDGALYVYICGTTCRPHMLPDRSFYPTLSCSLLFSPNQIWSVHYKKDRVNIIMSQSKAKCWSLCAHSGRQLNMRCMFHDQSLYMPRSWTAFCLVRGVLSRK